MNLCETERLNIRHLKETDAPFILRLLNEKSFLDNIGDKNVRNINDAKDYLINGPLMSYQTFGFGLNVLRLKNSETPIGMCGLLKRDELEYPDLGYALLPEFFSQGYAKEAAFGVLQHSRTHQYTNIVSAITLPDNTSSNNLLNKLGFVLKDSIQFYGCDNNYYEYVF